MEQSKSRDPIGSSPSVKSGVVLIERCSRVVFLAAFSLLGASCTLLSPVDPVSVVEARLNGRGPVYVSPDNPFLAANLFLKSEADKSAEVAGFLKLRGMPQRIEYSRSVFGDPHLTLFYDRTRESFEATKVEDVWVFDAPAPHTATLPQATASAQPLASDKNESASPDQRTDEPKLSDAASEQTTKRVPVSRGFRSEVAAPQRGPQLSAVVAKCRALGGFQPAERSPGGDLIHYVVDERETASLIAEWYTGESGPAETILRLNRLSPAQPLTVGDQLVIPKYLVKNGDQLGSRALRCVLTEKAVNH